MSKKRILTLALVLAFVIVAATGSWLLGSTIQSPAEAAARTAPPAPSPILVPVEERVLTADVVTRGTARFGLPQSITLAPSVLKSEAGVVTTIPIRGTQLNEGDIFLTASGRPLFILQGDIPIYRDFVPGIAGDDVLQLEAALQRLGYDPGTVDGRFDAQTSTAVSDWYTAAGFEPFGATAEQLATIRELEKALSEAHNQKLAAEDAAATAPLAIDAAQADLWAASSAAQAAVDELTIIRDELWRDWALDQDRAIADANLAAAKAAAGAAWTSGQATVQAAVDAKTAAEREVQSAIAFIQQLTAELEIAQNNAGVKLPLDEVVFLPLLPVRVEAVEVGVGDTASGAIAIVTNNQLAIDASLPLDEAPLVQPGMVVVIDEPDLGVAATGTVSWVAASPGTNGADGFHIYFETLVDDTPATLEGASLRLTIAVESTGGVVTAVPISALFLAADGSSRVQVEADGGLRFVTVEPGLSADGYVEVVALDDTLAAGQLVVIGFETQQ